MLLTSHADRQTQTYRIISLSEMTSTAAGPAAAAAAAAVTAPLADWRCHVTAVCSLSLSVSPEINLALSETASTTIAFKRKSSLVIQRQRSLQKEKEMCSQLFKDQNT